jgi:hypothetical protein
MEKQRNGWNNVSSVGHRAHHSGSRNTPSTTMRKTRSTTHGGGGARGRPGEEDGGVEVVEGQQNELW